MGNKRNSGSRRIESQSSDRDENTTENTHTTFDDVSENVNSIFDRNLGSELKEPSQISNEIEAITQRLSEQNNHKMTQIKQQLNSKFEKILKEIRTNKESILVDDEEDAEDNRPCTSNSENRYLRKKHASNNETDKNRNQDNCFQSSEMHDLRKPSTPFGVANVTLDDTIIINESRQEAGYHNSNIPEVIVQKNFERLVCQIDFILADVIRHVATVWVSKGVDKALFL